MPTTNQLAATLLAAFAALLITLPNISFGQEEQPEKKITFDDHVKPVLTQRCSSCHGGGKKEADLDVTNYTNLMLGGGSGEVISAGSASDSYLYKLITHEESPEMPPSGNKIPEKEIQLIANWIDAGALENKGSKSRAKPKVDMAAGTPTSTRPDHVAVPLRMPLEPVLETQLPSIAAIATSPWAPFAAVAVPKQILLYNTQSLQLVGVIPFPEGVAHDLKFSRNGSLLLAGGGKDGQSGSVVLFDLESGGRITKLGEEPDAVLAADVSSDHQWVALGGPQKLVKILATSNGRVVHEFNKHTDWVTAIEFSPDGKFLATGDRNGGLHVWETETGNELFTLKGHTASISGLAWRADSKVLASASEDTNVKAWELKNGKQIKSWAAHGGGVTAIEFLRDGKLATAGRDKFAKLWDQNGKLIRQFAGLTDVAVVVSWCDETKRMLGGDWTGQLQVWNGDDGKPLGNLTANPPSLASRLADANAKLKQANVQLVPLTAQAEKTKIEIQQKVTVRTESQQKRSQAEAQITAWEKEVAAARQELVSLNAGLNKAQTQLQEKKSTQSLAQQKITTAQEASQAAPADQQLKDKVSQQEAELAKIGTEISGLAESNTQSIEKKKTTQNRLNELVGNLKKHREILKTFTAQVKKLEAETAELNKRLDAENKALSPVQAEIAQQQNLIQRWNRNLEFIGQLNDLKNQVAEKQQVVGERQTHLEAATLKLNEAKKQVDAANQQKLAAEAEADAVRQTIRQLQQVPPSK